MPIDNIKAAAIIKTPDEVTNRITEKFEWNGLIFAPIYGKYNLINRYKADYRNLYFCMTDGRLEVKNSLQKFYKYNNYEDFSYTELKEAVGMLSELIKIKPANLIIGKLEAGLNMSLEKPVSELLPLFLDYKGKEFDKNRIGSKLWGVECSLYEYLIKFYDKVAQIKKTEKIDILDEILRYEIVYLRRRKVPICTFEDLMVKDKLNMVMNHCVETFKAINFSDQIDFSNMESRDRELFHAGLQHQFWEVEKSLNKETAKSKKECFKKLIEKNKIENNKGMLLSHICGKIETLMNN